MSIILFGKPKTFDEFINKAKQKRITQVNVMIVSKNDSKPDIYHSRAILVAAKTQLKLTDYSMPWSALGGVERIKFDWISMEESALKEGIEYALKLSAQGFSVTICDRQIQEAEKDLLRYRTAMNTFLSKGTIPAYCGTLRKRYGT